MPSKDYHKIGCLTLNKPDTNTRTVDPMYQRLGFHYYMDASKCACCRRRNYIMNKKHKICLLCFCSRDED